ncbi:acyl-CoA N-acyltransferase [Agrocybe pediades]|nr:acyl-CoA N-acyltransferase [Agrocybe pediades]
MFTTDRLILRGMRDSDLNDLLNLYGDERVAPWVTEDYVVPKHENHKRWLINWMESALLSCVIEEKLKDPFASRFVGVIGFVAPADRKNRNAVLFITLSPDKWGKGYGFEAINFLVDYAFFDMGMHRVSLTAFEGNDRAIELYRRIGFVEEGRHRKINWIKGAWRDTFYFGILEDEWAEKKKQQAVTDGSRST